MLYKSYYYCILYVRDLLCIYFLLKGEEPPVCIRCDKRLTIEHILLTCSDFIETRESNFRAKSLRMLFKDISPEKIFYCLKEINIFGKI